MSLKYQLTKTYQFIPMNVLGKHQPELDCGTAPVQTGKQSSSNPSASLWPDQVRLSILTTVWLPLGSHLHSYPSPTQDSSWVVFGKVFKTARHCDWHAYHLARPEQCACVLSALTQFSTSSTRLTLRKTFWVVEIRDHQIGSPPPISAVRFVKFLFLGWPPLSHSSTQFRTVSQLHPSQATDCAAQVSLALSSSAGSPLNHSMVPSSGCLHVVG